MIFYLDEKRYSSIWCRKHNEIDCHNYFVFMILGKERYWAVLLYISRTNCKNNWENSLILISLNVREMENALTTATIWCLFEKLDIIIIIVELQH